MSQYFWPENFKINDFAVHFASKGYKVDVLTSIPNYPSGTFFDGYGIFSKKNEQYKGVSINRVIVIPRGNANKLRLFLNYISYVISASIRIIKFKKKYDIIFIYEPSPITVALPAILLKKIKKIPIVFWVTDLWPESVIAAGNLKSKLIPNILTHLVKYIYNKCDKILVTSNGFINSIVSKGIDKNKIEFFPQWAESFFKPAKSKNILPHQLSSKKNFKIMFAGNIGESQDFNSIINAAKLLKRKKNIHWVIVGRGRKYKWVKDKVLEYKLQDCFHMIGSKPINEMPDLYSSADAMLLSLKNESIFSITIPAKLQTYLACGKPVLGMINGEAAKIINDNKAGYTCKAESPESLADIVTKMSKLNKADINEISNNALKCNIKYFDRNNLLDRAEKIFNETISQDYKK